ncbi:hypothetical protein SKAU_G00344740 [Synaphobranchus kaupii]|uniref:Uncharacterized protein n=1 Tax=Synaphobranchus kaupii TaxID=118154 RepID=A0A9Q1IHK6_SYNKA|nr:hypothetical protein SKAU_G00344740 [Synaphobranchus kaupii]
MSNEIVFRTQLASIMEVLANAAVEEICKLVDDGYTVLHLQMSEYEKENAALKMRLHLMELNAVRGCAAQRTSPRENPLDHYSDGALQSRERPRGTAKDGPTVAGNGVLGNCGDICLPSLRPTGEESSSTTFDLKQVETADAENDRSEAVLIKEESPDECSDPHTDLKIPVQGALDSGAGDEEGVPALGLGVSPAECSEELAEQDRTGNRTGVWEVSGLEAVLRLQAETTAVERLGDAGLEGGAGTPSGRGSETPGHTQTGTEVQDRSRPFRGANSERRPAQSELRTISGELKGACVRLSSSSDSSDLKTDVVVIDCVKEESVSLHSEWDTEPAVPARPNVQHGRHRDDRKTEEARPEHVNPSSLPRVWQTSNFDAGGLNGTVACERQFGASSDFTAGSNNSAAREKRFICRSHSLPKAQRETFLQITGNLSCQAPGCVDVAGLDIEGEIQGALPDLGREQLVAIAEHLRDVVGVIEKSDLSFVEVEDLRPLLTSVQSRKLLLAFKRDCNRSEDLSAASVALELVPVEPEEVHPPTPVTIYEQPHSGSWLSRFQVPWGKFPLRLSSAIARGERPNPQDRRSMVRTVVEAMQALCHNPKRSACEQVAKIIVNTYPQTFADFSEKGERLGTGHYSLLRSLKSRVENVNRDNLIHRIRRPKRTSSNEDRGHPNSPKQVRQDVDSYGCTNWQPTDLPAGETADSLEDKRKTLSSIFNSTDPRAAERTEVDDLMVRTFVYQRHMINTCPPPSIAEIQEHWPFLFTRKGLCNHFHKLTDIDISACLSNALLTKGRRIVYFFASQKWKWTRGIPGVLEEIESYGALSNNQVAIAAIILMMKYFNEKEESIFTLADETATKTSLEVETSLATTPRLIMLGRHLMSATRWMVSVEGKVVFDLDRDDNFADALSVFFGSFYVFNLEYQEAACATLELIQRFFVKINPDEGTKCTSKVGTSRKTGAPVKRKVVSIHPRVTTFLQRLTEFERRSSN